MLHLAIFKLNFLLTFESLVLIAAFFLIAYIKKQEMGKWLLYGSVAIAIFVFSMMLCTSFNACFAGKCNEKEGSCKMEQGYGHFPSYMMRGGMGHCNEGMMSGHCKMGKGRCMMMEGCGSKEGCEHKEGGCLQEGENTCSSMMMDGKQCSSMDKKMRTCKGDTMPAKEMMKK